MATIVLSAVGAAAGASVGGGVLGLSSVVIGRAVGATVGRYLDQRLMGQGSAAVETGRVDRFRITGASEGATVGRVWGRMRVSGQVIWASQFKERVRTTGGGGKGSPQTPETTEYSYSVSLAIALCEGPILRVARIWADGQEVSRDDLNLRVYDGAEDQLPDPTIEAIEGVGQAPAYRGVAYVVMEDLPLAQFGNRVPQFTFEVIRGQEAADAETVSLQQDIEGVAIIPGTGEYALATTPVYYAYGRGRRQAANVNSPSNETDFRTSFGALSEELPNCRSISLIVSWFGDDLRCGDCTLKPKVESKAADGSGMPWSVSGLSRADAETIAQEDGRAVYGGTPTDRSVIEAIDEIRAAGREVMFYPFILMELLDGNGREDPWSGAPNQPRLPWRGRITTSRAPGQADTPDGTAQAEAEVAAFFGQAARSDFEVTENGVSYTGPAEFSYRRFILHYAHLCAAAGGVEAFCIGSEMRSLTQIRGAGNSFPAVEAMRTLAADVRAILGPDAKIGYAADWSEYFGYLPQDGSGDVFFHLDALWSDEQIDFVGIDNYMPLSDWRDGSDHADAERGSIYDLDYLESNVAGGEGFDWYYEHDAARDAQRRTPIIDTAYGEDWIFRFKDMAGWWSNAHHERIGGVRQEEPTDWVPGSKPIWFTEYGCAAIDKGTNQPNKFLDPKSSESALPRYSNGRRDDLIQMQYIRATIGFWARSENNPISDIYGDRMVDLSRAHVWAWDARPYPFFPGNAELWSDAENYGRGHWLNGRVSSLPLAEVVREICREAGVSDVDVSRLYGLVRGYIVAQTDTARAALQPLMLAHGVDAVERDGALVFRSRRGISDADVDPAEFVRSSDLDGALELARAPLAQTADRVRLSFVDADRDYETRTEEATLPGTSADTVAESELAMALTTAEGRRIVERWLAEARIARDTARFVLPPSALSTGAGDTVRIDDEAGGGLWRVDRVTLGDSQTIEAVRVEPGVYVPSDAVDGPVAQRAYLAPVPVEPLFLDLPLLTGSEVPHAPHVGALSVPWPGSVAVYASSSEDGFEFDLLLGRPMVVGTTESPLFAARPAIWDRGAPLRVRMAAGALSSATVASVLNGANTAAIGDGSAGNWEVLQFTDVRLIEDGVFEISGRLRGQAGTDGVMPDVWPTGSTLVLIDGALKQIDLLPAARGLARYYRIGPAQRPVDDMSYVERVEAFDGIGLRPYPVAHLKARRETTGDLELAWIRRTRIDGDSWQSVEVPLGEGAEVYVVRVIVGSDIVRETVTGQSSWTYTAASQAADAIAGAFRIEVAQVSDRFGAGPFTGIEIDE